MEKFNDYFNEKFEEPLEQDELHIVVLGKGGEEGTFAELAETVANKKGINFIMNRCPKIEYARFSGELGWAGVNSQFISNKKIVFKK